MSSYIILFYKHCRTLFRSEGNNKYVPNEIKFAQFVTDNKVENRNFNPINIQT